MTDQSVGFIGGGRIVKIIVGGLKKANRMPEDIVVSDVDPEILQRLKKEFPHIKVAPRDNTAPAVKDIVFLAVPPKVIPAVLSEIRTFLKPTTFFISLAPRFKIKSLQDKLKCFTKIARMIPNAGSIVNKGYNPIAFADTVSQEEKDFLIKFLSVLGECPVVLEKKMEAYAVITGMGPTYFWFQFVILKKIALSFGLTEDEAAWAIRQMAVGSIKTLFDSNLDPAAVMDLIPFKPMGEHEGEIVDLYRKKLSTLYEKMNQDA